MGWGGCVGVMFAAMREHGVRNVSIASLRPYDGVPKYSGAHTRGISTMRFTSVAWGFRASHAVFRFETEFTHLQAVRAFTPHLGCYVSGQRDASPELHPSERPRCEASFLKVRNVDPKSRAEF